MEPTKIIQTITIKVEKGGIFIEDNVGDKLRAIGILEAAKHILFNQKILVNGKSKQDDTGEDPISPTPEIDDDGANKPTYSDDQ